MKTAQLKEYLEDHYTRYNDLPFIKDDPISIPHSYSDQRDIEITAFWTAMLAWGQRVTIINKSKELFALMGNSPYDFIVNHKESDRARFSEWKHRTFNYTDTLYFLSFLQWYYRNHDSLETAFLYPGYSSDDFDMKQALSYFHTQFFSLEDAPRRTQKHVATPARKSSCKRLNMYLRWMVRNDEKQIDFGIWKNIPTAALHLPLDVHVQRVALRLKLMKRTQADWRAVEELTKKLRTFDLQDPCKYDYALFGIGVSEKNAGSPFD